MVAGSAGLLLAVLWPAVSPDALDDFPISDYTMFANRRPSVSVFDIAVLVDPDGLEHRLDPMAVGGTDQPVQAVETVRQAIRAGETDALCAEIARGLDAGGVVEVISVRYDTVAWFAGDRAPVRRDVHASCPTEPSP